jgi:hypothetical protein
MKTIAKIYILFLVTFMPAASFAQLSDLDLESIDLDNLPDLGAGGEEAEPEPMEKINAKAEELSGQIKEAVDTLKNANSNEKLKQLDSVAAKIQGALNEISEKGELGKVLAAAINDAETTMQHYRAKERDPNASPAQRARYGALADDFESTQGDLYNQKLAMNRAKTRMESQLKLIEEDKEYIGDLLKMKSFKRAVEQLKAITNKFNSISDDFDDLTKGLVQDAQQSPEETGSN